MSDAHVATMYSETITVRGNGVVHIRHGLNNRWVVVQVFDPESLDYVQAQIKLLDINTVELDFCTQWTLRHKRSMLRPWRRKPYIGVTRGFIDKPFPVRVVVYG